MWSSDCSYILFTRCQFCVLSVIILLKCLTKAGEDSRTTSLSMSCMISFNFKSPLEGRIVMLTFYRCCCEKPLVIIVIYASVGHEITPKLLTLQHFHTSQQNPLISQEPFLHTTILNLLNSWNNKFPFAFTPAICAQSSAKIPHPEVWGMGCSENVENTDPDRLWGNYGMFSISSERDDHLHLSLNALNNALPSVIWP